MADEPIWTSAQILHPFKPGAYVKAFWLEARQPGVPPPSNHTRGFLRKAPPPAPPPPGMGVKVGDRPLMRTNTTAGIALLHRGSLQARSALRSQMSGSRHRRVDCPRRLRIDEALSSFLDDAAHSSDMLFQQACHAHFSLVQ